MATRQTAVNQALNDSAVRHAIWLQRYGGSSAKKVLKLLAEAESDMARRIAARSAMLAKRPSAVEAGSGLVTSARLDSLLAAIRRQNRDLRTAMERSLRADLRGLAEAEVDIAARRLDEALGVDLGNLRPSPEVLRSLVDGKIARGETIRQWWGKLSRRRQASLEAAVRLGMVEGDDIRTMARRLRTTEHVTRVQAEALVRTAVTAVASQARTALYETNDDVVAEEMWVSTLDSRTSDICISLDGKRWPVGTAHIRPPAHPRCRSTLSPVTKTWEELGATNLKPGRGARKLDDLLDRQLKEKGFDPGARREIIAAQRRASMPGSVQLGRRRPTYQQWLKAQPAAFQDEVLGKAKGALFRRGGLTVDKFVDVKTGRPFTLDELKARESAAWAKANLNGGEAA